MEKKVHTAVNEVSQCLCSEETIEGITTISSAGTFTTSFKAWQRELVFQHWSRPVSRSRVISNWVPAINLTVLVLVSQSFLGHDMIKNSKSDGLTRIQISSRLSPPIGSGLGGSGYPLLLISRHHSEYLRLLLTGGTCQTRPG
ncbi:hypothetical protein RRG08_052870 [Elysia crispata]|uniref:Uncharacterized protein n=1 Tax=Elysia crispata TaxID=231223 RepID=A0AAE1EF42_9GAST|nr:hypothetical protein RRG08_052870 [Elysia crispata]